MPAFPAPSPDPLAPGLEYGGRIPSLPPYGPVGTGPPMLAFNLRIRHTCFPETSARSKNLGEPDVKLGRPRLETLHWEES